MNAPTWLNTCDWGFPTPFASARINACLHIKCLLPSHLKKKLNVSTNFNKSTSDLMKIRSAVELLHADGQTTLMVQKTKTFLQLSVSNAPLKKNMK